MKLAILLCTVLFATHAEESKMSEVAGRLTDPSGAVVPSITVKATNVATQEIYMIRTDRYGNYVMRLRPGTYSVSVESAGFAKFTREGLALAAGETSILDVALRLSAVSQEVTVTAKAPRSEGQLETRTRNFQEVLEIREARESSAKDVGEALARLDGLWKIRKGGIASDVVLRGFQQDNINVLVDGLRIYGACPNNMDPPAFHVDFAEIEQVEIIKGVFDIRNQGSLGGAINIINKEPSRGLRVTPNFSAGSFGFFNPSVTASASNEKFYGLAGYSFRRSGPYIDGAGRRFTEYANYRESSRGREAFDIQTGWFRFGAAPSEKHRLDLAYARQGGGEVLYPYLLMDALYDNADRVRASYLISDPSHVVRQLRIQAYFTRVKHWMTDEHRISSQGAPRPFGMATYAGTKALGGRAEAEFSSFTAGFEAYRRNWNAVTMLRPAGYAGQPSMPNVNMTVAGLYGQYRRMLFDRLQLYAGGRLDTARSEARSASLNADLYWAYKGTRSRSATDTNPSGSVWLAYSLAKGLELFSGVGRTARPPDPQERYFALKRMDSDWVGNPDLRPVENTEADAGINYRGRWFTLRPTVFYSRLADFITVHSQPKVNPVPFVTNSAARSFENTNARLYGGELTYSAGLGRAVLLSGGLSYSRGTKDAKPSRRIFDSNLAEMPPLKARAALRYGNRRFFVETEGLAARAQDRVDSDLREGRTPGYAILNLKTGVHTRTFNLAVGIDNLFDRFYYEHFSYQRDPFRSGAKVPEPGRSLFVTVSYEF